MKKSLRLTESAIMLALAFVLSFLKVVDMPFGGSITACSMLPIAIIAYRYGNLWGLFSGFVYSLLQMLMGMKNLTYGTSAGAVVAIVLLDYVVAFTVLGLSGVFRGKFKSNGSALACGTFIACVLRYICHVIAGCTVWAGVSIPSSDGLIYSLTYNAAYMIPETLLTVVGAYFAGKLLSLTSEQVHRVKSESGVGVLAALPAALGVVIAFIMLFGMMQTEEGFDITAIASTEIFDWIGFIVVLIVGIATSFIIKLVGSKKEKHA